MDKKKYEEILQKLIEREKNTPLELTEIDDSELKSDLVEIAKLDQELGCIQEELTSRQSNHARVQTEYFIDNLRQQQQVENVHSSNGDGMRDDGRSFWFRINDNFWGWVIRRFDLLANRDEVLSSRNIHFDLTSGFKHIYPVVLLIAGIIVIFSLLNDPQNPTVPSNKMPLQYVKEINAESSMFLKLTDSVELAMKKQSVLRKISDKKVQLVKGNIWLDVEKNGKGFEVISRFGTVKVTGTSFGVQVIGDGAQISVSEGTVIVSQGLQRVEISAGKVMNINTEGFQEIASREEGLVRPKWVLAMRGVVPYVPDSNTALLMHLDEKKGTQSPHREGRIVLNQYDHVVKDISGHSFSARTLCKDEFVESPFGDYSATNGLGTAAYLSCAEENILNGLDQVLMGKNQYSPSLLQIQDNYGGNQNRIFLESTERKIGGGKRFPVDLNMDAFNSESFTIECWISNDRGFFPGSNPGIFWIDDQSIRELRQNVSYIGFGLTTANNLQQHRLVIFYVTADGKLAQYKTEEAFVLPENEWHHVAVVYDASGAQPKVQFYLDSENSTGDSPRSGTLVGEIENVIPRRLFAKDAQGGFDLGAYIVGSNSLNGFLDEFRFSTVARNEFNLAR